MNIIVNVDKNWAIGYKGALLFPLSEDLRHFARLTTEKIVVMGRATLESLPAGKPLKNRENIVLSRSKTDFYSGTQSENLSRCDSVDALKILLASKRFAAYKSEDVFVIGGQSVYEQLLNECDTAYITKVAAAAPHADSFFPNLDCLPQWQLAEESEQKIQDRVPFTFCRYTKIT